ncbi:MAG: hypothetical protein KJ971_08600 [Firmicutes bacterium]|nr:hypothetical protein [Bacillota bacterium]
MMTVTRETVKGYDTWQGGKYQYDFKRKDIAKAIRKDIADAIACGNLPAALTVSVTSKFQGFTARITMKVTGGVPFAVYERIAGKDYPALTAKWRELKSTLLAIAAEYSEGESHMQSDYYRANFHAECYIEPTYDQSHYALVGGRIIGGRKE